MAGEAYSTTCVKPHDWDPVVCNDEPNPGERCQTLPRAIKNMYSVCAPTACPVEVTSKYGVCKGTLGSNHWFTVSDGARDIRCTCGCYSEETVFNSASGELTAADLMEIKNSGEDHFTRLEGPEVFDLGLQDANFFPISDIIYGPEEKKLIAISTDKRRILLTGAHPVIFWKSGAEIMKVAKMASEGDFLVNKDGSPVKITKVEKISYPKNVVNFHINSPTHMVYANGFKTGDNAWQQLLALNEGRHLERNEIAAILIATRAAEGTE